MIKPLTKWTFSPVCTKEGAAGAEAAEEAAGAPDGAAQHGGTAPALQDAARGGAGPPGGVAPQRHQRCHHGR